MSCPTSVARPPRQNLGSVFLQPEDTVLPHAPHLKTEDQGLGSGLCRMGPIQGVIKDLCSPLCSGPHPCPSTEVGTAFEVAAAMGVARLQDSRSRPPLCGGPLLSSSTAPFGRRTTAPQSPEHVALHARSCGSATPAAAHRPTPSDRVEATVFLYQNHQLKHVTESSWPLTGMKAVHLGHSLKTNAAGLLARSRSSVTGCEEDGSTWRGKSFRDG